MTQLDSITSSDSCTRSRGSDHALALAATGSTALAWTMWHLGGIDLAVHAGSGTQHVGLIGAMVTAAVASVAGLGLLRFLEGRVDHALRAWTVLACLVLLLSLLGPLGAVSLSAGLALLSLHLVVGSIVIVGARSSRCHGVA